MGKTIMDEQKTARVGVRDLQRLRRQGRRLVAITAYDHAFAQLADQAGVDLILVGDSLGMTCLGFATTVPVTLEHMLHHTAAVCRGVRRAMVIADMPFMSYHLSPEQALVNAARFLQEAGADGVKLEGGERLAPTVQRLVQAGIPVLGHIGILPQSVLADGGYHVRGRSPGEAAQLLADAQALAAAGAFAVVVEGVASAVAGQITAAVDIPTIGIGAGADCDGQIQVLHDLLGLTPEFVPKHAKPYLQLATQVRQALEQYGEEVRAGSFPGQEQSFT